MMAFEMSDVPEPCDPALTHSVGCQYAKDVEIKIGRLDRTATWLARPRSDWNASAYLTLHLLNIDRKAQPPPPTPRLPGPWELAVSKISLCYKLFSCSLIIREALKNVCLSMMMYSRLVDS